MHARIIPVILSGGSGSRLWPLSRSLYPKQLLSLLGEQTLLQQTAQRVLNPEKFAAPIIVSSEDHRFIVAEQLRQIACTPAAIILEAVSRNTALAIALAAVSAAQKSPEALLLILPADHAILDMSYFHTAIQAGQGAAQEGYIVTFGIKPDRPETGYGYISAPDRLNGLENIFKVHRFIEKPTESKAQEFLEKGDYYWNSGMFLAQAQSLLQEFHTHAPACLAMAQQALSAQKSDLDFIRPAANALEQAEDISIDHAIMEHTSRAAMVPVSAQMGWSDVGSWATLWELGEKNAEGCVLLGDVILEGCVDSYVRSDGPLVAGLGLKDMVVIASEDAVLVAPRSAAQDVKRIVTQLKRQSRPQVENHTKVWRPWGYYQSLHHGERFQVKRLSVTPGARLSLQKHFHRAEHWVVVEGTAEVTLEKSVHLLRENESIYIPLGAIHRVANPGRLPLTLIEVQSGSYLGEDDIVRFEDDYARPTL
jgi:mannose-1-phosphate guanylyltransferase / mannose-6-phosphate isomerase